MISQRSHYDLTTIRAPLEQRCALEHTLEQSAVCSRARARCSGAQKHALKQIACSARRALEQPACSSGAPTGATLLLQSSAPSALERRQLLWALASLWGACSGAGARAPEQLLRSTPACSPEHWATFAPRVTCRDAPSYTLYVFEAPLSLVWCVSHVSRIKGGGW